MAIPKSAQTISKLDREHSEVVAVIGDLIVDIKGYFNGTIESGINAVLDSTEISAGGVAGNIAWYLTQLGQKPLVIGSIGRDCFGSIIKRDLNEFGADCRMIKTVNGMTTGFFVIAIDRNGERTMIGDRGANKKVMVRVSELVKASPSWIHLSGYTLLNDDGNEVLKNVKIAAQKLGINYSVDLEGIGERDVELNLDGAVAICNKDMCDKRLRKNALITIIKAGNEGCYIEYQGKIKQHTPLPANPVDTTGAGDCFDAAFITAYLRAGDFDAACQFANAAAAFKVGLRGTRVELPEELLKGFFKG